MALEEALALVMARKPYIDANPKQSLTQVDIRSETE